MTVQELLNVLHTLSPTATVLCVKDLNVPNKFAVHDAVYTALAISRVVADDGTVFLDTARNVQVFGTCRKLLE